MQETSSRPVKAKAICDQKLTVAQADERGYNAEDQEGQVGADAACVLQPFADVEADDVENHGDQKQGQRKPEQKTAILCEGCAVRRRDVGGHGGAGKQEAGKIEDGVDPVGPAGDEAVEGAEGVAGPGVETAFFREARGEFVDDERAGDEEEDGGQNPEADGGGAVVAGGGDPAGAEDGGDVEE
jgi:hypothetical protein